MKKCDHCDKPAVVHEVVIKSGATKEVHLCAEHAQQKGIEVPATPVTALLSKLVEQHGLSKRAKGAGTCPSCGLTILEFRQTGTLGCPSCYDAFQPDLGTLIARAQGGATHHVGRAPRASSGSVERGMRRARLVQELDAAVAAEQYERAARIRDRLHQLDAGPAGPPGNPGASTKDPTGKGTPARRGATGGEPRGGSGGGAGRGSTEPGS